MKAVHLGMITSWCSRRHGQEVTNISTCLLAFRSKLPHRDLTLVCSIIACHWFSFTSKANQVVFIRVPTDCNRWRSKSTAIAGRCAAEATMWTHCCQIDCQNVAAFLPCGQKRSSNGPLLWYDKMWCHSCKMDAIGICQNVQEQCCSLTVNAQI